MYGCTLSVTLKYLWAHLLALNVLFNLILLVLLNDVSKLTVDCTEPAEPHAWCILNTLFLQDLANGTLALLGMPYITIDQRCRRKLRGFLYGSLKLIYDGC